MRGINRSANAEIRAASSSYMGSSRCMNCPPRNLSAAGHSLSGPVTDKRKSRRWSALWRWPTGLTTDRYLSIRRLSSYRDMARVCLPSCLPSHLFPCPWVHMHESFRLSQYSLIVFVQIVTISCALYLFTLYLTSSYKLIWAYSTRLYNIRLFLASISLHNLQKGDSCSVAKVPKSQTPRHFVPATPLLFGYKKFLIDWLIEFTSMSLIDCFNVKWIFEISPHHTKDQPIHQRYSFYIK